MEENQAMKDYIQRKTRISDDWKVSKILIVKQNLEWDATWLQELAN